MQRENAVDPVRIVVRVAQDLVRTAPPSGCYADLKEDLKVRLAKLRIPYEAGVVSEALDQLERGGASPLMPPPARLKPRIVEPEPAKPIIGPAHAKAFTDQLPGLVKSMPAIAPLTTAAEAAEEEQQARRRAWEMGIEL